MKHFYKIFSLLLVISCGGGGASSPEAVIPPAQNIPPQPLFKESPIRLIDAASYYSQACNIDLKVILNELQNYSVVHFKFEEEFLPNDKGMVSSL